MLFSTGIGARIAMKYLSAIYKAYGKGFRLKCKELGNNMYLVESERYSDEMQIELCLKHITQYYAPGLIYDIKATMTMRKFKMIDKKYRECDDCKKTPVKSIMQHKLGVLRPQ